MPAAAARGGPTIPSLRTRNRLAELGDEARYHRERLDIYRAKVYGPRATSMTRLRELERTSRMAEARLTAARRAESN